jgi:hypothetical protein
MGGHQRGLRTFLGCRYRVPADVIVAFADWTIAQGMFWFSSWGSDCERVHDLVDEVDIGDGVPEAKPIVMTT